VAAAALVMDALSYGFRGDRAPMERRLRAARDLSPNDADLEAFAWGAGRGICALVREERAEAVRAFSRAVQEDVPVGSLDTARAPLLLLREIAGEATEADVSAARATATPGAGWSDLWFGYATAAASGRRGDRDTAVATFERADAAARRHPLFRAIGLRLVAEAALRDSWGDPLEWLRDAEGVFVTGGQLRIAAACRDMLRQAGARATRRRGRDRRLPERLLRAGVTAREAEVLALVGDRLSNKEIASRLYLSPRTVEKHVASLLLKLGASDRAALSQLAGDDAPPRMGA
jgi:DNA-binding CsgD family transcriptional regulator